MSIKEIEIAILHLSMKEISELTEWLIAYHAKCWDEEIEKDLDDGRLDYILDEVEKEYQAGLASFL